MDAQKDALQFISLFAGIGGLDRGLEVAGMRCVAQVEINDYCRRVLTKHWPDVPKFSDIKKFKRGMIDERVDLICGGFPCQDISSAGKKVGITGARSGLWKEMLRIIRAFRPSYVLVENVTALRARGLDIVLSDLAASGFDAEWDCFPASAFGAPHYRDRIFILAYAKRLGWGVSPSAFSAIASSQFRRWLPTKHGRAIEIVGRKYGRYPRHLRMGHGAADPLDRLHACGNAVYWPIARAIGKGIIEFDQRINRKNETKNTDDQKE